MGKGDTFVLLITPLTSVVQICCRVSPIRRECLLACVLVGISTQYLPSVNTLDTCPNCVHLPDPRVCLDRSHLPIGLPAGSGLGSRGHVCLWLRRLRAYPWHSIRQPIPELTKGGRSSIGLSMYPIPLLLNGIPGKGLPIAMLAKPHCCGLPIGEADHIVFPCQT